MWCVVCVASREVVTRAKRGLREMQAFWRKSEKEVTENKKRAKRAEEEKRKKEEERREVYVSTPPFLSPFVACYLSSSCCLSVA